MHGNTVLRVNAGASARVCYGAWVIMSKRLHGRHGWTPAPQFITFFYAAPVYAAWPFFHPAPAPRAVGRRTTPCCTRRRRRARADFSPLRAGCRWGSAAPDSQHQHPLSATHAQASPGRQLLVMRQAVRNNVRRTPHSDAPVHASDAP